jgi:hypothetical protein
MREDQAKERTALALPIFGHGVEADIMRYQRALQGACSPKQLIVR